jgi:hypothetical protein
LLDGGHTFERIDTHLQQHANRISLTPVFHNAPVHDTIEVETAKLNTSPGGLDPKPFPEMRPSPVTRTATHSPSAMTSCILRVKSGKV